MHTIRLLTMCEEIGREGKLKVRRSDREFLLKIKKGDFEYDELLEMAEEKIRMIDEVYLHAKMPKEPDLGTLNAQLVQVRKEYYAINSNDAVA